MGNCTTRVFVAGSDVRVGTDLGVVSELVADPEATVWIDVADPEPEQLERLAAELGLHHLAIEDALDEHQRDKLVHYHDHVFVVFHDAVLDADEAELRTVEIDAFVGSTWLVTVHDGAAAVLESALRRRESTPELAGLGVGGLLYSLLDVVVDRYLATLDCFEEYYDAAADLVFADEPIEPSEQRRWFEMRRALNLFDRIVTPIADGLGSLTDRDLHRFERAAAPYLRDVAGEVRRATVEIDALRDIVGQIVEVNIMLRDFRQNLVMKKVTSWAAIVAVPTLVTGWYGMNVPYPGFAQTSGVIVATALSVGASGVLYVLFRRNRWL